MKNSSRGQRGKYRRRHLGSELLEHAHGPSKVTIAHMDHPEIKDGEVPFLHYLNEPSVAQQLRLNQRRKVANSGARKQCSRKTCIVVHRQERLEHQSLLFLS